MLDVTLIGTAGKVPLPNRYLSSALFTMNGSSVLIDCGEGTQTALRRFNKKVKSIDVICITHLHADHTAGLVGVLLAIADTHRTNPLNIIGPPGVKSLVNAALSMVPKLRFRTETEEIRPKNDYRFNKFRIRPFYAEHSIVCYGYNVFVDRNPKFSVEKAKELGVPEQYWDLLLQGSTVYCDNGLVVNPEDVCCEKRKGIKVSYLTDSRPNRSIIAEVSDADLFICEGMYPSQRMASNALDTKHMTFSEAARLASAANVREMWLTHYCQMILDPDKSLELSKCKEIFDNIKAGHDGLEAKLLYKDNAPDS